MGAGESGFGRQPGHCAFGGVTDDRLLELGGNVVETADEPLDCLEQDAAFVQKLSDFCPPGVTEGPEGIEIAGRRVPSSSAGKSRWEPSSILAKNSIRRSGPATRAVTLRVLEDQSLRLGH